MTQQNTQSDAEDGRWRQTYELIAAHPSVADSRFWDDFHRAMSDLINGNSEQVCLNRQNDQGPIQVQWTPVTVGQKERWPGTGPG